MSLTSLTVGLWLRSDLATIISLTSKPWVSVWEKHYHHLTLNHYIPLNSIWFSWNIWFDHHPTTTTHHNKHLDPRDRRISWSRSRCSMSRQSDAAGADAGVVPAGANLSCLLSLCCHQLQLLFVAVDVGARGKPVVEEVLVQMHLPRLPSPQVMLRLIENHGKSIENHENHEKL